MDVSSLQIRRLPPAPCPERNEVALLLAEAFDDSPLFRSAFPRPKVRSAALGFLFRALLADAARYGRADTASTDRIVGALLWYLPGGYPIPMARALRSLPRYLQLIGCSPSGALKLCRRSRIATVISWRRAQTRAFGSTPYWGGACSRKRMRTIGRSTSKRRIAGPSICTAD
jgi:hypothetical protein